MGKKKSLAERLRGILYGGRGDRTRTCDSLVPNQERYQLRYTSFLRVTKSVQPNAKNSFFAEAKPDFATDFLNRMQRYTFSVTLANFSAIIS